MSIWRRLERLEAAGAADSCGPGCPPEAVVIHRQDGYDGEPVPEERKPPAPCPRCGRPARVLELVVVYDPNFYGNAELLEEARREAAAGAAGGPGAAADG
jgi:hypothetical protein